jgi:hypothetical protein
MAEMTPREIEQSLEAERQALAASIAALTDRFAPAALFAQGKSALRNQALPLLGQIDGAVRSQPLAAAIAGVAIATLVFSPRTTRSPKIPTLAGSQFEALTQWEDEGGTTLPDPVEPDDDWLVDAIGLRSKATDLLSRIDDAARRRIVPAAELATHRAAVIAALARDTARTLGDGLESLSGAARESAIAARELLYLHQAKLADSAQRTVTSNPIVSGAVLAAIGAATAWLFPSTETEDCLFGEARDGLVDEARKAVSDEVTRVSAFARTLGDALRSDLATVRGAVKPAQSEPRRHYQH